MARLEIIKGVVQDLRIAQGNEDLVFTQDDKILAAGAAIGTAAAGQIFNSTVLVSADADTSIDMEFFTCKIDGHVLFGCFYKVEFTENEFIEFVIEKNEDERTAVQAARSNTRRMLWMLPYETRGHLAQRKSDTKWTLILSFAAVLAVGISEFFIRKSDPNEPIIYEILFYLAIFGIVLVINFMIRRRFIHFAYHATEVLKKFDYETPAEVDLNVLHKDAQRKMHKESGKLPPLVQPWSFRY